MNEFVIKFSNPLGKKIIEDNKYKIIGYYLFPILVSRYGEEAETLKTHGIFITTPNSAKATHPKRKPKDSNGNLLKTYTYVDYKLNKILTYDTEVGGERNVIWISTVNQAYAAGSDKNGSCVFEPSEHYSIEVVGNEVVQTNSVAMPEWKVSRTIYFKYFWLFYIVAKDYWEKYPDDIYIESSDPKLPFTGQERIELLNKEKPIFDEALVLAKQNYPEFALAEQMVEEKKKEGTYWSELEAVYQESQRLKKEIGHGTEDKTSPEQPKSENLL